MYRLLSELQSYRGTGIAAKLYYESKVAEALSLVVEYQKKRSVSDHKLVSQDLERIQTVAAYLSDHYAGEVPIERLAQIACMGTTKLKSSFKKVYGCTITEYIQQRRMSQAEYLLAHTDLQIGQIAQTIGYSTSSRFAELFRRSTGLLPLEYRKMAKQKVIQSQNPKNHSKTVRGEADIPPLVLILYPPALSPLSDLDKVPVSSLLAHQLLMGTMLSNAPILHH